MATGDHAHVVTSLLVGRASLVSVLSAQAACRALGDIQALGDGSQVSEVVQADAAYEAALSL